MSNGTDDETTYEGHREGRAALRAWRESQPTNFFEADPHFRRVLPLYAKADRLDDLVVELSRFGAEAATVVDDLVKQNNEKENLPRLDRWTGIGERTEKIEHHPTYHEAGEYIYGSGIMEAYKDHPNSVGVLSRMYVSSHNGEAGHNCPIACTAGVIRVLQELAPDDIKETYLPRFLDRDYDTHYEGAQFLTEVQGGSDVGKNATRAVEQDDGSYRIFGEKWFCSNIDADVFLMTARFEDAPEGTRGLGLFFVPRMLEDGTVNEFYVRRLKEKIGTRTMASGECDFRGAVAYHMGEPEDGFKNMMNLVINTSRLYNAFACVGSARRAYLVAQGYAQHRVAFGQPILNYPLVKETLANVKAELDAMVSSCIHMAWLQDRKDADELGDVENQFMRMALNLNKVRTAKGSRWASVESIEILGGNGAIESFSVLPRLLRDSIVTENWEGTHNTLQMQIMRDMAKYKVHEGFFAYLNGCLEAARDEDAEVVADVREHIGNVMEDLSELTQVDEGAATLMMRPLMDRLSWIMYAAIRLWERGQLETTDEVDNASLEHFVEWRLGKETDRRDPAYLERIDTISSST
jgi:hypothetical protein